MHVDSNKMAPSFLTTQGVSRRTRASVVSFYRTALRLIGRLEFDHRKTWYDYLRLKMQENASLHNEQRIRSLLERGREEVDWVQTIISRRDDGSG